ncbi:BETA-GALACTOSIDASE [Salix purpurea]|uniref:beta-galactosidase n=1 Tax=Salix purpurea TaxID=77065 RepID=A0A9Q0WPL9_SALPP|nr:BETA-GALACTOSIDASE [Salix purpurea]
MCVQEDAPDPVINTCNGFYCDQFTPNSPYKPKMWTENYSGWFLAFGSAVPYRPVEDLAFAVAKFFEHGGTFQNYYMYFGGTNFGRTAGGPLVATSYDYDAPINEYGFIRQPKWGHLRDLHSAIKQCEEYLVSSDPVHQKLGNNLEAHVYYKHSNDCAAFLANYDSGSDANVTFNSNTYFLPAWSVSILADCKNVIFNTAKVVTQRHIGDALFSRSTTVDGNLVYWSRLIQQKTPVIFFGTQPVFMWKLDKHKEQFLNIESLGHAALVFVNKRFVAFGYGNHDDASFSLTQKISLEEGNNTLDVLSMLIGVQNYGPWFDVQGAGIHSVFLVDLHESKERSLFRENGPTRWDLKGNTLDWITSSLIWYKATILAPEGNGPLALNLASMGKGQAWINGQSIGRYWSTYLSPSTGCTDNCDYRGSYNSFKCQKKCGQPAQTLYHIPRTWVHPGDNLLVLHEELGGDPSQVSLLTQTGQDICSIVSEDDPPPADSWKPNLEFMSQSPEVRLSCEHGWHIAAINFASFGTPEGKCGTFTPGNCHADMLTIVKKACIGQDGLFNSCISS